MRLKPCWSCGADNEPCDDAVCHCAKCIDPEGYEAWRYGNPEEYQAWLSRQDVDEDPRRGSA
jgi:hypothetical protein